MTHVTCRLTAKTRDQLRNPTLGNRVWTTFTFLRAFSCRPYVPQVLWASTRQPESPVPSQCKSRAHSVWMWALFTCLKIIVSNMDYGGVQLWCVCVCLVAGEVMDRAIQVAEPYTAIRLVSSGWSYNSVTVRYQKLAVADYDLWPLDVDVVTLTKIKKNVALIDRVFYRWNADWHGP